MAFCVPEVDWVGCATRWNQQYPVNLLLQQDVQIFGFLTLGLVRVAEDDAEALLAGSILHTTGNRREEGIGDIGQDQRDGLGLLEAQAASERIGNIAKLRNRPLNPFARFQADVARIIDDTRDGHF
jgi:hypothetical protein